MLFGRVSLPASGDSASAVLHASTNTGECCLGMYPTTFSLSLDHEPAISCEPGSTASAPAAVHPNMFNNVASYPATTALPWMGFMDSGNLRHCSLPPPHAPVMEEGGGSYRQQQCSENSPTSSDMGGGGETPLAGSPALGVCCSSLSAATFCGVMPGIPAPCNAVPAASTAQTAPHASIPDAHRSLVDGSAAGSSTTLMLRQLLLQQQQLQQQLQQQQQWQMGTACSDGLSPSLIGLQLRGLQPQPQKGGSDVPSCAAAGAVELPSTTAARTVSAQQASQPSLSTAARSTLLPLSKAADSVAPLGGSSGGGGAFRSGSGELSTDFLTSLKRNLDTHEQDMPPFRQLTYRASGSSSQLLAHLGTTTKNRDAQRRFRQRQREAFASMEARVRAQEQQLQSLYREKRMVEQHNEVLLRQLRAYEQNAEQQQQRQQQQEEEQKRQQARPPADTGHDDSYRPQLCCLCGSAIMQPR